MTFVCIVWNIILNINIISSDCFNIIYSYDYLSMIMFIVNSIILLSIFIIFIIFVIYYYCKQKKNKNNENVVEDVVELLNKV